MVGNNLFSEEDNFYLTGVLTNQYFSKQYSFFKNSLKFSRIQIEKCGIEWVWLLEDFIRCATSYNWSPILWWHDFYTHQHANIISEHVEIPSPNCFILKHFSFSRNRNVSCYDVISVATFQGCQASILAARWYSIIHSTKVLKFYVDTEFVEEHWKHQISRSMNSLLTKVSLSNSFSDFWFFKEKLFHKIC